MSYKFQPTQAPFVVVKKSLSNFYCVPIKMLFWGKSVFFQYLYYSVVTVIEYTKNQTDHLSLSEIVQFIIDTIDDNKYLFEDMYGVKNVRSGKHCLNSHYSSSI